MADFEQKTDEYGTTVLKLIRIKSSIAGNIKFFGNVMLVIKKFKENDLEMMTVRIVSISSQSSVTANLNNIAASEKLSINKMTALVNHKSNSVDFGPPQGVFIEEGLRGRGIGTFAFNEIVVWLKTDFPEYSVNPFEFSLGEYGENINKQIRNDFLEHFGFTVSFSDNIQNSGSIKIKKVNMLKEHYNSEKIEEHNIEKYVFGLITDKYKLEKEYSDLKKVYETRGEEILNGVPKSDIVKYTMIGCGAAILILIALLI